MPNDSLGYIKEEIMLLIQKNDALTYEYKLLKKQYESLYQKMKQKSSEFGSGEQYFALLQQKLGVVQTQTNAIDRNLNELENNLFKEQFRVDLLQNQVRENEEQKQLLAGRLKSLRNQKYSMDLILEEKKIELTRLDKDQSEDLEELRVQIKFNMEEEKNLTKRLYELEKEYILFPKKAQLFKSSNKDLQAALNRITRHKQLKEDETRHLQDKKELLLQSTQEVIDQQQLEKTNLENIVSELDMEYKTLNKKVEVFIDRRQRKKVVLSQIIAIDKENQQLREKIEELQIVLDLK
ncbi:MAG: hypothetical protein K8S27_04845 [Candidatus Omnitrophica bacterium]|nr:hypothetical protein [Candidatus Omnitrophota bacterium]